MHGFEVEKVNDNYIIPFVGKDIPWWQNCTNINKFTKEKFNMQATVLDTITVEDIKQYTNVHNIQVEKLPYWIYDDKYNPSKDAFYLVRKDTKEVLNNFVSNVYKPIDHIYSLDKAEQLRQKFEDKLSYYSSGVLFSGKLFWIQLEQAVDYVVTDDKLLLTLVFLSNHNGANNIYTSITRICCNNTMQISLSNVNQQLFITHRAEADNQYDKLLNAFEADTMSFKDSIEMFKYWNTLDLKQQEMVDLIRFSLGLEEDNEYKDNYKYKAVVELIETQKGVELMKGKYTAYRVFNALTEASQHLRRNKIYNSMFGTVTNFIERFKIKLNENT